MGSNQVESTALLDSGAQANLISYRLYKQLKLTSQLHPTPQVLESSTSHSLKTLGWTILHVQIHQYIYPHKFYVVKDESTQHPMLLGQPWQKEYNVQIDWNANAVKIQHAQEQQM
ncbi:retropepsin-like aspartic protease, partial [Enterobacter cloacae complex sp. GF14B]|uniref:retropepsin-like aspartic protease n=1 Tax=Enterobacter cloacae complex sp. GF14B TaxID=2511982 RepID=UPI00159EF291